MATINSINSNIPIELSKGGTNATSMATTNGTVYYDGTRLVTTATGTSGQVLVSNGAGVAPTFQTVAGSLVFIQSQTAASSTTVDFTTGITSTYNNYYFLISNMLVNTATAVFQMQVSTDGGGTWTAGTGYNSGAKRVSFNGNTWVAGSAASAAQWNLSEALSTGLLPRYFGYITFYNISNGGVPSYSGCAIDDPNATGVMGYNALSGYQSAVTTINGFRFTVSTGNMTTGFFSLYGIKES